MTGTQLDELASVTREWLETEKGFYAQGRGYTREQFLAVMREHALPLIESLREAQAEVARLRDIVAVNDQRLADVWDTAKRVLKGEGK